ncbi:MAG: VWA domain-containing protein, partial [Lachnospiraceae bacterium]|nr:VWA domain-containing protein [Lachnospiraceae bacterium]
MTRNRRKSTLALLLSLVMVFSLLPGYAFAADEDPAIYQKSSDTQDDALHMRKTLSKNDDGTYDIVIESWATGTVDIETITRTRPTDFILIVDQSGSMEDPMQVVRAHSGNVTWWDISNSNIYLYQDPEDGQMYRLEATRNGNWALGTYIIRYTNGVQYKTVDSGNLLEMLFGNVSVSGSRVFSYTNGSVSRLNALKTAANHFLDLVKEKSDEESGTVYGDHRVAVIGFSSNPGRYTTNEILSGTKGHLTSTNLNTISDGAYDSALQQVQTSAGMTNLRNAISSITANGGTQPEYGFQIAQRVVERRNARGDNMYNTDEERNTVIVFFTDGQPGLYSFEPNDSNRQTDNHIKAANTAVASALPLKNLGASVFSIGVFAAGDSQPVIDYVETSSSGMTNYDNQFYDYERSGSFITGYSYEYWLRGNKKENDEPYNDTVADYMRCMSSDYQQAENFLNRSTANHEQGRSDNNRKGRTLGFEYYTLASDEQALRAAFEAVAESSITPVSGTELNSSAVLVDHIYMADFDVSGATVSAKTVDIQWDAATESVVPTGAEESFPAENITNTVRDDGGVSVTGFDYKENFCSEGHPGKKLVVMIKNLEPKVGGHLWSNSGDASIFPDADSTTAVLGVASPEENIARVTRVIDFNAKMTFATGVQRWRAVNTFKNGTYSLDSGNFNYQLLPDLSMTDPASSLVMSGADTALALGSDTVWTEYTAIPASSVYFDDDLLDTTLNVGDGSGFNEGVTVSPATENLAKGQHTYVFYGTGIDVYCTTTDE